MDGDWWLGDLGSAVQVGAAIHSTTDWFSQQKLKGQPAKTTYDWYMLAVALAAEVHKADWKEELIQDGHCPADKVVAAVKEVQSKALLDLLQTSFCVVLKCYSCVPCVLQLALYWQAYILCQPCIKAELALTRHCRACRAGHGEFPAPL